MAIRLIDLEREILALPIEPEKIPYSFEIKLEDKTYIFVIKYNLVGGFFTIDLLNKQNEPLCYGDIIRYGRPLFSPVEDSQFPIPIIIPKGIGNGESEVTLSNIGKTVFLYLYPRDGFSKEEKGELLT